MTPEIWETIKTIRARHFNLSRAIRMYAGNREYEIKRELQDNGVKVNQEIWLYVKDRLNEIFMYQRRIGRFEWDESPKGKRMHYFARKSLRKSTRRIKRECFFVDKIDIFNNKNTSENNIKKAIISDNYGTNT